jgi:hypothetical protein
MQHFNVLIHMLSKNKLCRAHYQKHPILNSVSCGQQILMSYQIGRYVKEPTVNMPDANVPTVNMPSANVPTINMPKANVPTINMPNASVPTVKVPSANVPTVNMPDANVPTVNLPNASVPTIKVPTSMLSTGKLSTIEQNVDSIVMFFFTINGAQFIVDELLG